MTWEDLITQYDQDYEKIANYLDQQPNLSIADQFHLSMALILQGKLETASNLWSKISSEHLEKLQDVFRQESRRQEALKNYQACYDLRQVIRHFFPNDFTNLVQLFYQMLHLCLVTPTTVAELNLIEVIKLTEFNVGSDNSTVLLQLLQNYINSPIHGEQKIELISLILQHISNDLLEQAVSITLSFVNRFEVNLAVQLLDICYDLFPQHQGAISLRTDILTRHNRHAEAIAYAEKYLEEHKDNLFSSIVASHSLLAALLHTGGKWQDAETLFNRHELLIREIVAANSTKIPMIPLSFIMLFSFFVPYLRDTPRHTRSLQNAISQLFQINVENYKSVLVTQLQEHQLIRNLTQKSSDDPNRKLKIGFLTNTFRQHSVGWLARFLVQYLDRSQFELYAYFTNYMEGTDFLEEWYVSKMDKVYRANVEYWGDHFQIASQIDLDEIDILIDIESTTSGACCQIVALKPAPLQVTWLGWDASGIPAIDYYIADNYVLPADAQEYYTEKIWRLPNSYLAVDGFEASVPTLTREQLEIPPDGIVYFSSQKSDKRHPETVRLQMQILKQVPNSYFLIKGLADQNLIKEFFYEMVEAEGGRREQLRFLPYTNEEGEHRGNLAIADVILDTYPYNGATTTMEVLWMGIPIVTRVGEQFVARNSYTMLMNVGVTEGIAWTPTEYVNWGVRFGTEPDLRRDVAWKLRQSRKTSPLWNGRQFAEEMGKAFKEMWEIHNA